MPNGPAYRPAMRILAISGSARRLSTNTALLRATSAAVAADHQVRVYDRIADLPVFSPDLELPEPPPMVRDFLRLIGGADGIIISSPEYVRAIPGGLKNAVDWLVSGDLITRKPVVLAHASHRGDDMLAQLRLVLATVSEAFAPEIFLRLDLMRLSPGQIAAQLAGSQEQARIRRFVDAFASHCAAQVVVAR